MPAAIPILSAAAAVGGVVMQSKAQKAQEEEQRKAENRARNEAAKVDVSDDSTADVDISGADDSDITRGAKPKKKKKSNKSASLGSALSTGGKRVGGL